MNAEDLRSLARVLLYGTPDTRRALARRLSRNGARELWPLLVETVRSNEPWLLRARCLEVLGLVVGTADPDTATAILSSLLSR